MSEQIDQFCDNLKTRLNAIEKRLLDAKAALEAAPQQAKLALESGVTEVRASLEERRHEVEAVRHRATSDLQRAVAEGKQKVEEWRSTAVPGSMAKNHPGSGRQNKVNKTALRAPARVSTTVLQSMCHGSRDGFWDLPPILRIAGSHSQSLFQQASILPLS
jgi:hypothetical protein